MILSKGRKEKRAKVLLALQMAHFTSWPLWALVYDPWPTKREKGLNRITLQRVIRRPAGHAGRADSGVDFNVGETLRAARSLSQQLTHCARKRWKIENQGISGHGRIQDL